ncbi:MAG: threonine/serine exporter family protein [Clostridia bacterium]|uniref:threonine/serine exporter family protein n=1 Tax=Mogibacterium kristiansenii TaxID=2606708 RepID=UPI002594A619|nr:threonine/serine exporter family protein [uncultured Mogibacterium sp.]MDY5451030.1 threonine/serine exporter family protein [Clostridia bacterium]MEE0370370.1 threonine/serine exporter family protein [Clostridia bacterium]
MLVLASSFTTQLISCTIACVGFAYWFNVKGIQVLYSGIGAFFTWAVYYVCFEMTNSNFQSTLFGAIFVAIFAQIMARVNRAPATIFLCVCVFPLVPGPNLYYMMYYLVLENYKVAKEEAVTLVLTCVGIALGFIVVDIFNKYIVIIFKRLKGQLISEHGERY